MRSPSFSTVFIVRRALGHRVVRAGGEEAFELTIKAGDEHRRLRPKIEAILRRFKLAFELRTSSDEEVCYDVHVPLDVETERVTDAILQLDPEGHAAVDWAEKKNKAK